MWQYILALSIGLIGIWLGNYFTIEPVVLDCVDISPLYNNSATLEQIHVVADALKYAAKETGVIHITGHEINAKDRLHVFNVARDLFSLQNEIKSNVSFSREGFVRGFIRVAGESGSSKRVEAKEGFSYGFEWPKGKQTENVLQGPNHWPSEQYFSEKDKLNELFDAMVGISVRITTAIGVSLGWSTDYCKDLCDKGDTISLMRMFHYLSQKDPVYQNLCSKSTTQCIGSSEHTDWGFLTLIMEDEIVGPKGSLQVFKDGFWRPVVSNGKCSNPLVMNAGDFLSVQTNGVFQSPLHRVALQEEERFSFVFFYYPKYETKIRAVDDTIKQKLSLYTDQTADAKGKVNVPLSFGEYIYAKWSQVSRKT